MLRGPQHLRHAKISKESATTLQKKDVGRLDIAMKNRLPMEMCKSREDLCSEATSGGFSKAHIARVQLDQLLQRAAITELRDDEQLVSFQI
jgi:hypothetical protein